MHIRSCTNPALRHTVHPSAKCVFNFTDKLGGSEQNLDTDKLVLRVFLWKEATLRKRYFFEDFIHPALDSGVKEWNPITSAEGFFFFLYSQKDKVSIQLWKELGMRFPENLTALPNSETRPLYWFLYISDLTDLQRNIFLYPFLSFLKNLFYIVITVSLPSSFSITHLSSQFTFPMFLFRKGQVSTKHGTWSCGKTKHLPLY